VILGEGGLRSNLEITARRLGIESRVLIPGYVRDAKQYLPFFNMFAMPSLTEGLPIVLLEAMQAAVPIVASSVGGIPEVLEGGRCGLLVKPGCCESLVAGLTHVMQNPKDAEARAHSARRRVLENYSSEAMTQKYQEIYKKVLQ